MQAFWDASALVALCVPGQSDARSRRLLQDHPPVVWWGTAVEVAGAIARLKREAHITAAQAKAARTRLELLGAAWREVQPVAEIRELAAEQLDRYDLTAAHALQLAAALVWCNRRPARRIFLAKDVRLTQAARMAGFAAIGL